VIERAALGFLLASLMVLVAVRSRALTRDGGVAAVAVGTICVAAGWGWAALLLVFFVTSSALSRVREAARARLTESVIAKGGARDALQVLANGGIFTLAALLSLLLPWAGWLPLGAGAIAASTADTWSSEVGTLSPTSPVLVTSWKRVPAGTSGAVTPLGLGAAVAGALLIALVAWLVGWPPGAAVAAIIGGVAGALADSFAGALWQARRCCPRCGRHTERKVHICGTTTELTGGIPWLDNDGVNLLSCAAGAVVALLVWLG
jgi:Predicted membrane protein